MRHSWSIRASDSDCSNRSINLVCASSLTDGASPTKRRCQFPLIYEGISTGTGLRLDLLVEKSLIVEIKALEKLLPIHQSQLLTYLKLANLRLGFLINFNVTMFKQGVRRVIR